MQQVIKEEKSNKILRLLVLWKFLSIENIASLLFDKGQNTLSFFLEIGRHRSMIANEHIQIGSNSYEKVKTFKYLGSLLTNQNSVQEEIKCRLKAGNSYYYSVQQLLSS